MHIWADPDDKWHMLCMQRCPPPLCQRQDIQTKHFLHLQISSLGIQFKSVWATLFRLGSEKTLMPHIMNYEESDKANVLTIDLGHKVDIIQIKGGIRSLRSH